MEKHAASPLREKGRGNYSVQSQRGQSRRGSETEQFSPAQRGFCSERKKKTDILGYRAQKSGIGAIGEEASRTYRVEKKGSEKWHHQYVRILSFKHKDPTLRRFQEQKGGGRSDGREKGGGGRVAQPLAFARNRRESDGPRAELEKKGRRRVLSRKGGGTEKARSGRARERSGNSRDKFVKCRAKRGEKLSVQVRKEKKGAPYRSQGERRKTGPVRGYKRPTGRLFPPKKNCILLTSRSGKKKRGKGAQRQCR